ncbi:MAG: hypothetical protein VKI42_03660 [Synechococcaceae cyanobacterium]|nr:hypothetical protein [Synechococcaceae cyanobacterium]
MTPARRLLLLPLLAPLLAVLVLAALNPAPRLSLRLLVWRSASLPLGVWLALASSGGALVSAAAVGVSLGQGGRWAWSERRRPDRAAVRSGGGPARWRDADREPWQDASPPAPAPRPAPWSEPSGFSGGPSRSVGEPAPTVAVPFRVIQRPAQPVGFGSQGTAQAGRSWAAAVEAPARRSPVSAAPAAAAGEDWGAPPQDDW